MMIVDWEIQALKRQGAFDVLENNIYKPEELSPNHQDLDEKQLNIWFHRYMLYDLGDPKMDWSWQDLENPWNRIKFFITRKNSHL